MQLSIVNTDIMKCSGCQQYAPLCVVQMFPIGDHFGKSIHLDQMLYPLGISGIILQGTAQRFSRIVQRAHFSAFTASYCSSTSLSGAGVHRDTTTFTSRPNRNAGSSS